MSAGWRLDNAERLHRNAPRSFFIPPEEERRALLPGREVKLIFVGEAAVERMWVEVLEVPGSGTFAGQLLNEPRELNGLERGDRLTFGPEHVAAINYSAEELGYDPGLFLGVSPRVAAEDRSPALLLFQSSTDPAYSGWYTFTGEEGEHERSPAGLTVWSLGYLTDRFPEVAAVFREGGSAWTWDACAGTYRPLESSEVR